MHALGFVAGAGYLRTEQREKFRAPTEAKKEAWFPGVLTEKGTDTCHAGLRML